MPFTFNQYTTLSLVAPFFADIDIRGVGQINYEVHNKTTSQPILSRVNSLVNHHAQTVFNGEWMLVATWDGVPHTNTGIVSLYTVLLIMSLSSLIYPQTSTFQGILITDYSRSFAVFTYYCGDLRYSCGGLLLQVVSLLIILLLSMIQLSPLPA